MEMQERGWREERTAWTTDTTGQAVPVTTGLTRDRNGRLVAVLAIGVGPSAIMYPAGRSDSFLANLRANITSTVTALDEATGQAGQ